MTLRRLLQILSGLLILRVTVHVLLSYRDYFPPNFDSEFLRGRESYFFGPYRLAFVIHILSGPCSLVLGMVLLSERFRRRLPRWHRSLGRIQVACVLLLITPSGLWMAIYAETGAVAGAGFASLAMVTGLTATLGWRTAVKRKFVAHRRWMWRCYFLLCSAVVVRVIGGLATVAAFDADWLYPLTTWGSWILPLMVFELINWLDGRQPKTVPKFPL